MMNDQAQALRNLVRGREQGPEEGVGGKAAPELEPKQARGTRIVTVTSGKGGVGKSNFTLNFALQLQELGFRVLVFDADIGMANIDVLMGAVPQYNLYDWLRREKSIEEVICRGSNDLAFIAGGSGFNDMMSLTAEELDDFTGQLLSLGDQLDFILFDTGAGLTKESFTFITAADETIVVTTPEPTSLTDAYAIIKMVHARAPDVRFQLVVNRVSDKKEGQQTADKIRTVSNRFLQLDIPALGYIPDDPHVSKAVKRQIPFSTLYPETAAARDLRELAIRYSRPLAAPQTAGDVQNSGVRRFLSRMLRYLK